MNETAIALPMRDGMTQIVISRLEENQLKEKYVKIEPYAMQIMM